MTVELPVTRWRITALDGFSPRLDVTLTVDTDAKTIVAAIEKAARRNGVHLERLKPRTAERV